MGGREMKKAMNKAAKQYEQTVGCTIQATIELIKRIKLYINSRTNANN